MGPVSGGPNQSCKMKPSTCISSGVLCILLLCLSTHALYLTEDERPSSMEEHNISPSGLGVVTMVKRRPEMGAQGFLGDNLSGGFGHFYTMKRANSRWPVKSSLLYINRLLNTQSPSKKQKEETATDSRLNAFLNLLEHSQE